MIRVLHVVNGFHPGGVETQLIRILRGYDRSRFLMDACVIGGDPGPLADEAREQGAAILSCEKSPDLAGFSRRFFRLIQTRNYDVVHSHFEAWSGPLLRGARMAGVPVRIAQFHSVKPWPNEQNDPLALRAARAVVSVWGRYWICRHATHLLAVSNAVMGQRCPSSCREADITSVVWTGGVDTQKFSPGDRPVGVGPTPPTILWVGALRRVKRIDLHLRILQLVRRDVNEARLVLVGTGVLEHELRAMAKHLGVADAVDFLGVRQDVPDLLRAATVFLSCSDTEGLPTVLLEAQAAGVPVVARDIAPHREALCEALHPFIFQADAIKEAAAHLIRLLTDAGLRDNLSAIGRNFVMDNYSAETQLRKLENFYESWFEARRELE